MEEGNILKIVIESTKPKIPNIEKWSSATIVPPKGNPELKPKKEILLAQYLCNSLFVKSEIVKESLRIIKECCNTSFRRIDEEKMGVKVLNLLPVIKEVDCIIYELSSMLDIASRQVDIIMKLGKGKDSTINRIRLKCKEMYPTDIISTTIDEFYNSDSQKYFRKMRNRVSHMLPFDLRIMGVNIYFPDDPYNDDITTSITQKIEVPSQCETWIVEFLSFLDTLIGLILHKIGIKYEN